MGAIQSDPMDRRIHNDSNILFGLCMAWRSTCPRLLLSPDLIKYEGMPSGYVSLELLDAWDMLEITERTPPDAIVAAIKLEVFGALWNATKAEVVAMTQWLQGAEHWRGARLEYDVEDGDRLEESIQLVPPTPESRAWITAYLDRFDNQTVVEYSGFRTRMECQIPARVMNGRYGDDQYLRFKTGDEILEVFAQPIAAFAQWEELMEGLQRHE